MSYRDPGDDLGHLLQRLEERVRQLEYRRNPEIPPPPPPSEGGCTCVYEDTCSVAVTGTGSLADPVAISMVGPYWEPLTGGGGPPPPP